MANEDTSTKKKKLPWETSYSSTTQKGVEQRVGITIDDLVDTVVTSKEMEMLVQAGYSLT